MGNLFIFSDRLRQRHLEAIVDKLSSLEVNSVRVGASLTYKHGLVVNVMGRACLGAASMY